VKNQGCFKTTLVKNKLIILSIANCTSRKNFKSTISLLNLLSYAKSLGKEDTQLAYNFVLHFRFRLIYQTKFLPLHESLHFKVPALKIYCDGLIRRASIRPRIALLVIKHGARSNLGSKFLLEGKKNFARHFSTPRRHPN
jgi:hypothetical protein